MAFGYFDKKRRVGILATNLKSVATFSEISYNILVNWLRNGETIHENEDHLLFKTDCIIKGRQKVKR